MTVGEVGACLPFRRMPIQSMTKSVTYGVVWQGHVYVCMLIFPSLFTFPLSGLHALHPSSLLECSMSLDTTSIL